MATPELSIVIPVYNEEAVIAETLRAVVEYVAMRQIAGEILVVDDGSTDRTEAIVRELARTTPAIRLLEVPHGGKGAAVKRGILEAAGTFLLFMDADHATRIEAWDDCAPWLRKGFPMVIGSRKMRGANVQRHQPPLREAMGKVFTWLTNMLLGTKVSDITCGFKCFQRDAARAMCALQRIGGWGFDAELLLIARQFGYAIKEVPVAWRDDPQTKVHLASDAVRSFLELLRIRLGVVRGWYPTGRAFHPHGESAESSEVLRESA